MSAVYVPLGCFEEKICKAMNIAHGLALKCTLPRRVECCNTVGCSEGKIIQGRTHCTFLEK